MPRFVRPAIAALGLAMTCAGANAATVIIIIDGIAVGKGIVNVAFCDKGPLEECRQFGADQPAVAETLGFRFENVPPGNYGFVGFQDFDSSGENERNMLGMPKEPFVVGHGEGAKLIPPPGHEDIITPVVDGVDNVFRLTLRTLKGTTKKPDAPTLALEQVPLMDVPPVMSADGTIAPPQLAPPQLAKPKP